jgi:gamma-glutamyl-gamma-aminobutyrate hydrolase PuuD
MRQRPLIGVTVDYNDAQTQYSSPYAYCVAVEKAGGLPVMLPYHADLTLIPDYVSRLDGMLFSGGNDLDPAAWGETRHENAVAIDPQRERFERELMNAVEAKRLPTLGICLGSQLMNVQRGGTLHQFIPALSTDIEHRKLDRGWAPRHEVTIEPDAIIARAIGKTRVQANTSHKQSINQVGKGLRIIARSPDGIIEGIEDPTLPLWVGVQWHPERQHDEPDHFALFKLLVEKASAR